MNSNLTIHNLKPPTSGQASPVARPLPVGNRSQHADQQQATATAKAAENAPPVDPRELEEAVSKLNEHAQSLQRSLEFGIDEDSGRSVITVVDSETREVIRQIPSEITLAIARRLHAFSDETGVLMSETA